VDETEIKRITDALLRAYPPRGQDNEPKAASTYGFDIEGERRREAGFLEEIRHRWEAEITAMIAALSFREAKTMPESPHEYVVRTPENEAVA
jgi:hypothetical protein